MGYYQERLLPRFQDRVMRRKATRPVRARLCSELTGKVVEIGFGTGLNAPYYPPSVTKVAAVEPSELCLRLAAPRVWPWRSAQVELAGLTGERLDLPSDEFDCAISTWTLCTIPDLRAALGEVRRVLKPGGTFCFVEHGLAPDANIERWQHRLEPLNKRLAGGCHLTRQMPRFIEEAGFSITQLDEYYFEGEPRPFGYTFEGHALAPVG